MTPAEVPERLLAAAIGCTHWGLPVVRADVLWPMVQVLAPRCERRFLLLGDVLELQTIAPRDACRAGAPWLLAALEMLPYPAKLLWRTGNHDELAGEVLAGGGRFVIDDRDGPLFVGSGTWAMHGDEWDPHRWAFRVADRLDGSRLLRPIARRIQRWDSGRIGSNAPKEHYRSAARETVDELPVGATLLHAHTHRAEVFEHGGRRVVDAGFGALGQGAVQTLDTTWHPVVWTAV